MRLWELPTSIGVVRLHWKVWTGELSQKCRYSLIQPFLGALPDCPSSSPVFEMIYERNPVRCKFERRLEVSTSPLNIIYNPQAIKKVTEFFYKGRVHTSGKSLSLLFAVRLKFTLQHLR